MSAAMTDSRVSRLIARRGPDDTGVTAAEKSGSGLRAGSGVMVSASFLEVADSFHSAMMRRPVEVGDEISVWQTRRRHMRHYFANSNLSSNLFDRFFRSD